LMYLGGEPVDKVGNVRSAQRTAERYSEAEGVAEGVGCIYVGDDQAGQPRADVGIEVVVDVEDSVGALALCPSLLQAISKGAVVVDTEEGGVRVVVLVTDELVVGRNEASKTVAVHELTIVKGKDCFGGSSIVAKLSIVDGHVLDVKLANTRGIALWWSVLLNDQELACTIERRLCSGNDVSVSGWADPPMVASSESQRVVNVTEQIIVSGGSVAADQLLDVVQEAISSLLVLYIGALQVEVDKITKGWVSVDESSIV